MRNDRWLFGISGKALVLAVALALLALLALPATPAGAQSISLPAVGEPAAASNGSATVSVPAHLRSSTRGLVVVDSMMVGGGVLVDLQGGFQNVVTATAHADGTATTDCATATGVPQGAER